jgi:hypothetical protein
MTVDQTEDRLFVFLPLPLLCYRYVSLDIVPQRFFQNEIHSATGIPEDRRPLCLPAVKRGNRISSGDTFGQEVVGSCSSYSDILIDGVTTRTAGQKLGKLRFCNRTSDPVTSTLKGTFSAPGCCGRRALSSGILERTNNNLPWRKHFSPVVRFHYLRERHQPRRSRGRPNLPYPNASSQNSVSMPRPNLRNRLIRRLRDLYLGVKDQRRPSSSQAVRGNRAMLT